MSAARSLYIVGLGASAGGLEALENFFDHVDPDTGLAFVVIQHLSPDYKSLMVELLSKHTQMPVKRIEDGIEVEANTVYLIPPKTNVVLKDDHLHLTEPDHSLGINLPIDIFFRSLAEEKGEHAISIVLSGTGSDGMRGVRSIKEQGGMAMVQDPESAKFDGMPQSAISTGLIDYMLPPQDMGRQLVSYIKHPVISQSNNPPFTADEGALNKVLAILRSQTGVNFTHYKSNTIIRRIDRRLSINQLQSIDEYVRLLQQSPREVNLLYKELLIGVTRFFRDGEAFEVLEKKVIPEIFKNNDAGEPIRIWVTACSTGEEAYSLGMLVQEYMNRNGLRRDVKIFATDIDRDAVEFASNGVYPESIAADVCAERLQTFFICKEGNYRINRQIREMVIFATHNLLRDPPFTKIDLITCRNMLIYLQAILQKKVLSLFSFALKPGRFMMLGTSETIGDMTAQFAAIDNKWKIYANRTTSRMPLSESLSLGSVQEHLHQTRLTNSSMAHPEEEEHLLSQLRKEILPLIAPPMLVVNENNILLHSFGKIGRFFQVPEGKASFDIQRMATKDLASPISTALHKARREKAEIQYSGIRISLDDDQTVQLNLTVRPMNAGQTHDQLMLVIIDEQPQPEHSGEIDTSNYTLDSTIHQRIEDLEQELLYTKENLQATIEELETSNEELQATNEELLASNEELQSTNEELQSVNEELYTVNAEYQSKIQELSELNEDVDNLLRNTRIGTIFLGEDLRVRKFTDALTPIINLMPHDIGRPIEHLSTKLKYDHLVEDTKTVMRTRRPLEMEVEDQQGHWHLMRILPYQSDSSPLPQGVVITFIDIESLKKAEFERGRLAELIRDAELPLIVIDLNGTITSWNRGAERLYGYNPEEILNSSFSTLLPEEQNAELDTVLKAIRSGETIDHQQTEHKSKDGQRLPISLTASPVRSSGKDIIGATLIPYRQQTRAT